MCGENEASGRVPYGMRQWRSSGVIQPRRVAITARSTSRDFVDEELQCFVLLEGIDGCAFGVPNEQGTNVSRVELESYNGNEAGARIYIFPAIRDAERSKVFSIQVIGYYVA